MRYALRRVLWILPTLVAVTALAFAVFSSMRGQQQAAGEELPLFFNAQPRDARQRALEAVQQVARGGKAADPAQRDLVRLGGAALPYVLPGFDAFAPDARARIALALAPLAQRMNLGGKDDFDDAESAILFWTRFWQDRGVDFRPVVVKRLVQRVADQSSALRRSDVLELDTYVLPELFAGMSSIHGAADVARARRLADLAAHVTGVELRIAPEASLGEAQRVVEAWQRWWLEHRAEYTTFDGPRRMMAMITETRYGRWAAEATRSRLGRTQQGEPIVALLRERAPVTLWLAASALAAGYLLGIFWGLLVPAHGPPDWTSSILAVMGVALPVAAVAAWLGPSTAARPLPAALLMTLSSGALVSRYQRAAARNVLHQDFVRTELAFGAAPWRVRLRSFPAASAAVVSLLAVELPTIFTSAFVVEHAFGLPGIGQATLRAVAERDVSWLMAVTLGLALLVALAQIASDTLLGVLDPRVRLAFLRQRGALE